MGTKGVRDGYNQGRQDGTGLEAAAAPVQANHVRHPSRQGSIKSTFSFLGGASCQLTDPDFRLFYYLHGNIWMFLPLDRLLQQNEFSKGSFFLNKKLKKNQS